MTTLGTPDDALGELLARLRWTATSTDESRLGRGDRVAHDGDSVTLHQVLAGSVRVDRDGRAVEIAAGDLLLLTRGGAHTVTACDDAALFTVELRLDDGASAIAAALPEMLVTCCFLVREPLIAQLLELMREERGAGRPGAAAMTTALANVVAAAAIRAWIESGCADPSSWLVTLRDPHIARAVEAMHAEPGRHWSVEGLARLARSSRSSFSERFRATVGEPPLRYLARIRMDRAKELLGRERWSVGQTASVLGYCSEVAFSRAFRRHAGDSPSAWRQRALEAGAARPQSPSPSPSPSSLSGS
ncbi:AraC family transcriptional regulator [Herbiconiux sp. A18JL235]|uniref:AraC family transcriptional regulator n=1 Tax=Herbiconiux sp. A18JL235 TaxID=3152363 RepID=A0AB39BF39_9MICO